TVFQAGASSIPEHPYDLSLRGHWISFLAFANSNPTYLQDSILESVLMREARAGAQRGAPDAQHRLRIGVAKAESLVTCLFFPTPGDEQCLFLVGQARGLPNLSASRSGKSRHPDTAACGS